MTAIQNLIASLIPTQMRNRELQVENKQLRAALKFYADAYTYTVRTVDDDIITIQPIWRDRGYKAREALKETDNA